MTRRSSVGRTPISDRFGTAQAALTDIGGDVERLPEPFDLDEQLEPTTEHMVDTAVPREVLEWECDRAIRCPHGLRH